MANGKVDGVIEEKTGAKNPLQNTNIAKNLIPIARGNLTTQSFSIPANSVITISLVGNYVKYDSGNGDIRIQTTGGVDIRRKVGSAIRIRQFNKLYITNLTGTLDQKTFTIGFGEVKDNFITGSIENVETIETVDVLTEITEPVKIAPEQDIDSLAEICFTGGAIGNNVASNFAHVGLRNPAGSGVNLFIDEIRGVLASASFHRLLLTIINQSDLMTPDDVPLNKLIGGGVGGGVIVAGNHTAQYGTSFDRFSAYTSTAGGQFTKKYKNSIILPPDYTLFIIPTTSNLNMLAGFDWREKPV